jgi:hypothetical protein
MQGEKLSNLLMVWLFANGHDILDFKEGVGITTHHKGKQWKFDLSGHYGGIKVKYKDMILYFYKDNKLLTQTDLNEFSSAQ